MEQGHDFKVHRLGLVTGAGTFPRGSIMVAAHDHRFPEGKGLIRLDDAQEDGGDLRLTQDRAGDRAVGGEKPINPFGHVWLFHRAAKIIENIMFQVLK